MLTILKKFFIKYSIHIFFIIILIFINIYFQTCPSKILGNIIDLLQVPNNEELIVNKIAFLIFSALAIILLRIVWKYLAAIVSRTLEKDLRDNLFSHFLKINLNSIQNIKNGELMSYFIKDVNEVKRFVYSCISDGVRVVAILLIATYTMKNVNLTLTIAVLTPIIITDIIIVFIRKYIEKYFKKSQNYYTKLSEYVQESTDGIRTIKTYSCEDSQISKFIKKNNLLKRGNIAVDLYSTLLSISVNICFGFCYGITIIYGSKLVLNGIISVGEFVAFNGYIDLFFYPIFSIPRLIARFKRAQISYRRLDYIFSIEEESLRLINESNENIHGDIKINNLTFTYPEYTDKVLKNINIEIKEGQTLGIIGTIGSGKTTLMNLLLRLYSIPNGKILIGDKDINDIDLVSLRNSICYITQDNFLFSTTIKDNIELFKEGFNDEQIHLSTEKAMFADDIKEMKEGIYTIIGERGIDLSGGQKQRVVISRAFLNNKNIVIFDDTFSALDNKTEEYLLKNIKELSHNKTCIMISNRISDVKDSDQIIVLDEGRIVEQGTHRNLINNNGLYHKFYIQQLSKSNEIFS